MAAKSRQIYMAVDAWRRGGRKDGMSKRIPTLLRWIEAHEVRRKSEQTILARRASEWEERARDVKALAPESATPMQGVRSRLTQMRDLLLGRSGRTA